MKKYGFTLKTKKYYDNIFKDGYYLIDKRNGQGFGLIKRIGDKYCFENTNVVYNIKPDDLLVAFSDIEFEHEVDELNLYLEKWNKMVEDVSYVNENSKLKKITRLTSKRKKALKTRLKEKDFDFDKIIAEIKKSDFLIGWKNFNFYWVVSNDDNYIKIMEGNYRNEEEESKTVSDSYEIING
ncbi:MAG: hypothetical protein OMM_00967 [Candidatus Magnetoglobus multicellularis str. Araruama]|uniref:Uncharacterized protein n=1 Tax=Candidatus Magnetoglobus multicellularis str. Araruama TaxID=890399 RepID=A0A1V1PEV9_9BACT|nr:MAG: hypothetical protein OMM_00967 [Candidatus Magnetoglobus multicellularis str. Araruama]